MSIVFRRIVLLYILIYSIGATVYAQPFNSRYITDRVVTSFGSLLLYQDTVIVSGFTSDAKYPYSPKSTLTDFNLSGKVIKQKWSTLDSSRVYGTHFNNLIRTKDSSLILVGVSSPALNYSDKGFFIKYNKDLTMAYCREYPRSIDNPDIDSFELLDVIELKDSSFIMIGMYYDFEPYYHTEIVLIRTDKEGNERWRKVLNKSAFDKYSQRMISYTDTSVLIVGNYGVLYPQHPDNGYGSYYILEVDTAGRVLQDKKGTSKRIFSTNDIVMDPSGGYLICSAAIDSCFYDDHIRQGYCTTYGDIMRLNANFELVWELKLGKPTVVTYFKDLLALKDGNYLAVGTTIDSLSNSGSLTQSGWLVKVSPQGQVLWQRRYYGVESLSEENILNDAEELPNGDIIACGVSIDHTGDYPQRGWLLRLDKFGCLQNDCQLTDNMQVIKQEDKLFNVFPNPANEVLYIESYLTPLQEQQGYSLLIVDALGKTIATHTQLNNGLCSISTQQWPVGTYWVSIFQNNQRILTQQIQKH